MRPGRLTPENLVNFSFFAFFFKSFNEAGAINPGKPPPSVSSNSTAISASMRPGRLTPENPITIRAVLKNAARFNEAGAINPGKPGRS